MSGDDFYSGQVVDTPTAREFTERALERVSKEELSDVAALLERKVEAFKAILANDALHSMTDAQSTALLR